ncbi:MAG: sortase, partial [Nocardioides sp.]|nr:sortase [Nocardioides sp.]
VATGVGAGRALAVLHIPRFGASWSWVVLEGTSDDVLADGPGHYTGTPLPGARGNVAIAGHRAGYGDPFLDFDALRPGDRIQLRQAGSTWDYTIDVAPRIVPASASWVLDPLPGRRLTLTTCWPRYGSSKRMFVRAHLTDTDQRSTESSTTLN